MVGSGWDVVFAPIGTPPADCLDCLRGGLAGAGAPMAPIADLAGTFACPDFTV